MWLINYKPDSSWHGIGFLFIKHTHIHKHTHIQMKRTEYTLATLVALLIVTLLMFGSFTV